MSEDEDSDAIDLIGVPEGEISVGNEEPSSAEIVVPRKTMSRGQRKKHGTRGESRVKRELGEGYLGYRRVRITEAKHTMAHDTPRVAKEMGPPCNSKKCRKWSTRFCSSLMKQKGPISFLGFGKNVLGRPENVNLRPCRHHPKKVRPNEEGRREGIAKECDLCLPFENW